MSLQALVIPEDPTHNGYILRPLVERLLAEAGKPNARVTILTNPKLKGVDQAAAALRSESLQVRYRHFQLWLFLPDADRVNDDRARALEDELAAQEITLCCCPAHPEVEAWLLAGFRDRLGISWPEVRAHPRLKEEVFMPFLATYGDERAAGGGREQLMRETLKNYRGLTTVCPELGVLERRVQETLFE